MQIYLQIFDKVEGKVKELEIKDQNQSFQSIIADVIIMDAFHLQLSRMVGKI